MYRYVLQRLATTVVVLFGVSVLTYVLIFFTPGDPARVILRQQMAREPTEADVARFRETHGLDEPLPVQYLNWLTDVLGGDLGESYYSSAQVGTIIARRVGDTAELAVAGMAIALVIAVPAGVISAVHRGSMPDYASQIGSLLGLSMPNFWLGYILIIVFSLHLDVFPTAGSGGLEYLVLPAITLGTAVAAIITRLLRSSMLEVLEEDYIRTARSMGLSERIVVYKHALRNALIPVVTIAGLQLGFLLNGAIIVEVVFQRPGLGMLLVDAIFNRNYPVVQGTVLLVAVLFVAVNFLVDVTYRYIDPRIQLEGPST
jgi:peptide/nickel transport system permease protein